MTATRIHNEHAAGASKPEPASSPSFGSVLADATTGGRAPRTAAVPVRGDSPAEPKSSTGHPPVPPTPKQALAVPAVQLGTGNRQQDSAAQSGSSEASSGRTPARETQASGDTGSHRQQQVTDGTQIPQPAAIVASVWGLPVTAQPSLAAAGSGSGVAPASAGRASATAPADSTAPAQSGRSDAHHGVAALSSGLQDAIACVAGDPTLNESAVGDAPASALPDAISGKLDSHQGVTGTQLQAVASLSVAPGALRPADAATSAVSGKVSGASTNQVSAVRSDGAVSSTGAGKQNSGGSATASSGSSGGASASAAAGNASSAHAQAPSVTVTAAPAKNSDTAAAPLAAMQAVPRETGQPTPASNRSEVRQAVDAHQADSLAQPGDPAPIAGINTAKVIQSMSETEMRVGLHSSEFGQISIRTLVSQQQMQAQISVDHSDLGHAIAAHLPGVQTKLANDHGLKAMIEVSQSGMSFSGERGSTPQRDRRSSSAPQKESIHPVTPHADSLAARGPSGEDAARLSIRA